MNIQIRRFLHFPIIIILAGVVTCMGLMFLIKVHVSQPILYWLFDNRDLADAIKNSISIIVLLVSYYFFEKIYERRKPEELSAKYLLKEIPVGFMAGFIIISLSIFILYLLGYYKIINISTSHYSFKLFTLLLAAALVEDLLTRGLIIRVLEKWLGTYITLIIAMLLETTHVFNPNSNLLTVLFDLIWGFTMAMLFIYTKRIWLPFFFHVGWNFSQPFYGSNLTGLDSMGTIIQSRFEGPSLLTGGAVGIEGSIFTGIFLFIVGIILFYLAKKEGKILPRRRNSSAKAS
jgi:membrane protease YdiL (CAAX protease family)